MPEFSLYRRMQEQGTLAEAAKDVPDARFALPSTINWMRGLAILVGELGPDFESARRFYVKVQRRTLSDREVNSIGEQLLFALHQMAALHAILDVPNKADVARIGIVAWYYGIYGAASAMVAAADGSFPETHAETAQCWNERFPAKGLAMPPFNDRVSSLLKEVIEAELAPVRARGKHALTRKPATAEQAWGCHAEYLVGTVSWEQENVCKRVKDRSEFKALQTNGFQTGKARALRDAACQKRSICFLHEAIRYRGKANYRDAIYLAYGKAVPKLLDSFIADLAMVLAGFAAMAAAYAAARMGRDGWHAFLDDLEAKRAVSLSPKAIWS